MAAEKKKVYGNMRIIAIEGKDIFRADTLTALKNGKLNADRFGGIIDESLDTDKLCEVYKAHEAEMGYPYLADKKYCRAIVSVSFDLAVKQYEQYGRRFVRYGYSVTDADMQDHACVREVNGSRCSWQSKSPTRRIIATLPWKVLSLPSFSESISSMMRKRRNTSGARRIFLLP